MIAARNHDRSNIPIWAVRVSTGTSAKFTNTLANNFLFIPKQIATSDVYLSPLSINKLHEFLTLEDAEASDTYEQGFYSQTRLTCPKIEEIS